MADLFLTVTVNADQQERIRFGNFKDSLGRPATVDGGFKMDGEGDGVSGGSAEVDLDPTDITGMTVRYKSDLAATEFPATSTHRGYFDTRHGEEVNRMNVIATIITLPAEAVSAEVESLGKEPRDAGEGESN